MADELYVRLHPYAPRLGFTLQGYVYENIRFIGGERPHWYVVERRFAEKLAQLPQNPSNLDSKPAFQVYTKEDKERVEKMETDKYMAAIGAMTATVSVPKEFQNPMTTDIRPRAAMPAGLPPVVTELHESQPEGRAAALPPPRVVTQSRTPWASVEPASGGELSTDDLPKGTTHRVDDGE